MVAALIRVVEPTSQEEQDRTYEEVHSLIDLAAAGDHTRE